EEVPEGSVLEVVPAGSVPEVAPVVSVTPELALVLDVVPAVEPPFDVGASPDSSSPSSLESDASAPEPASAIESELPAGGGDAEHANERRSTQERRGRVFDCTVRMSSFRASARLTPAERSSGQRPSCAWAGALVRLRRRATAERTRPPVPTARRAQPPRADRSQNAPDPALTARRTHPPPRRSPALVRSAHLHA